jgi:hypothetical protein
MLLLTLGRPAVVQEFSDVQEVAFCCAGTGENCPDFSGLLSALAMEDPAQQRHAGAAERSCITAARRCRRAFLRTGSTSARPTAPVPAARPCGQPFLHNREPDAAIPGSEPPPPVRSPSAPI